MFTVLFVEDDESMLEAARMRLEDHGIVLVEASSLQAIPDITDDKFDLVIWDGELRDGTTIAAIRKAAATFTKPMIAAAVNLQHEQMEAGCTHKMSKFEALTEAITMRISQVP